MEKKPTIREASASPFGLRISSCFVFSPVRPMVSHEQLVVTAKALQPFHNKITDDKNIDGTFSFIRQNIIFNLL